ncbi:hypothetical protein HYN59_15755 [Flavobacterium album]|uniref:Restriction endonuclease n=1 Tax=Flavobacterium album TaxID=2175091 RepID=A0A2S1R194_9FLAO|nr:hypothetical protein [Flavobacterium album]AWH86473.1 hypothetical protein HYN59_15755 [Flavobacterium album]
MSYQKEIRKHFEDNKEKFFPNIAGGKWRNSEIDYLHILPKNHEELNLLPIYRDSLNQYLETNRSCIKRHIYFHHLNSSQAMCLNFFFPLMEEQELDMILKFIGFEKEEIDYDKTCFEKTSDIEKGNYRATSFDFYIETKSGKKIFFEIKFTESKFGVAKFNDDHINKFNAVYKGNLGAIEEKYHQPATFCSNYQILRNLICISEDSYVVFLYPIKNKKIKTQAEFAKSNILKNEVKGNLFNLTWEDLLHYTESNLKSHKLKVHFRNFREKYNL